jgi:DNA polymerase III gamma/tau subunit
MIDDVTVQWAVTHRPQCLEDYVGQEDAVRMAQSFIKNPPKVLLITGYTGNGKTTLARILAYAINGLEYGTSTADISEKNVGDERGIDAIRAFASSMRFKPQNRVRILIVDEVHNLTPQGMNALLKPLEDGHGRQMWILCTNEPGKLPAVIRGRAAQINLKRNTPADVVKVLRRVAKLEGVLQPAKDYIEVYKRIANASDGVPREGIALLQSVAGLIEDGSSTDDTNSLVIEAIKRTPEVQVAKDATLILTHVYRGNREGVVQSFRNCQDLDYLITKLLDHNAVLIDELAQVDRYKTPDTAALLKLLAKHGGLPSLKRVGEMHGTLCDLKAALLQYQVPVDHLMLSRLLEATYAPRSRES